MVSTVLELLGLAALIVAGFLMGPVVGVAVAGVVLVTIGVFAESR